LISDVVSIRMTFLQFLTFGLQIIHITYLKTFDRVVVNIMGSMDTRFYTRTILGIRFSKFNDFPMRLVVCI
jgi:hypothetical protein